MPIFSLRTKPNYLIALGLLAVTLAVYAPVRDFDFINFDDPEGVSANPHVTGGLTTDAVRWAFTSGEASNWFPLTRLSHELDYEVYGAKPGMHHLTNVVLHALASLLLFVFLGYATGDRWPSASVAFLFALHPLHVESVAWITERKDVLCALFWFLTSWAWVRYVRQPGQGRYLVALVFFSMGLMSKPMIVTLPMVFLLLDVWPLQRAISSRLLLEKLPFLALTLASSVITFWVQLTGGAVRTFTQVPLGLRLENALITPVIYIADLFYPTRMALFYPFPDSIPAWQAAAAGIALLGVTVLVLRQFRNRPYLAVGWFWYLGTLVPVIGLVQVGAQARADRYMYVPMVGLAIMVAWGVAEWSRGRTAARPGTMRIVAVLAAAVCAALAAVTSVQLAWWKDSETLLRHTVEVTSKNYSMYLNLGNAVAEDRLRLPEAAEILQKTLEIKPDFPDAHNSLAILYAQMPGRREDAIRQVEEAVRIEPRNSIWRANLGVLLMTIPARREEGFRQLQTAVSIDPGNATAHSSLGAALWEMGRPNEALTEFETALRLNPADRKAQLGKKLAVGAQPLH